MIVNMIDQPSVVDFEERLHINRTTKHGEPTNALLYDYVLVTCDLADGKERLEGWGNACFLWEIVQKIHDFAHYTNEFKHAVELLLKNDELELIDKF